jgi:hypothetical protein
MARESVMSTPIFDQLLREMAQRAEPHGSTQQAPAQEATATGTATGTATATATATAEQTRTSAARRRHRAD